MTKVFKVGDILRSTDHEHLESSCYVKVEAIIEGLEKIYVLRRMYDNRVFPAPHSLVVEGGMERAEVDYESFKNVKPGDYFVDSDKRYSLILARLGDLLLLSEPTKSKEHKGLVKSVTKLLEDIEPVYGQVVEFAGNDTKEAHTQAQEAVSKLKKGVSDRNAFRNVGPWIWVEDAALRGFTIVKGEG